MSILLQNQNRLPTYTESRWNQYIEEAPLEIRDEFPQPEDDMYTTDGSVFNRSKKRKWNTSRYNTCRNNIWYIQPLKYNTLCVIN